MYCLVLTYALPSWSSTNNLHNFCNFVMIAENKRKIKIRYLHRSSIKLRVIEEDNNIYVKLHNVTWLKNASRWWTGVLYSVDSEHRISTPETPRWPRGVRYLVSSLLKEFSPYYKGAALFLPKKLKWIKKN